jgi:hypothetical protein
VHNKASAFRRFRDPGGVHRINFDPIEIEMREFAGRLLRPPVKRANAKATPGKRKSGLGAYAASRAYDQHDVISCHETLAYLSKNLWIERAIRRAKFARDSQSFHCRRSRRGARAA